MEEVTGDDLLWAAEQVLGPLETDEEIHARIDAERAQARADTIAAGCPPERVEKVACYLMGYRSVLRTITKMAAEALASAPAIDLSALYQAFEDALRLIGTGELGRTPEMVKADLADALARGEEMGKRIALLATAHRDRS